jgi:metallophosphoesterase superfamily enzyme
MQIAEDWLLTPCRMAIHLPTATGVIADLHLGYAQARRRSGEAVPQPDLERVLGPLRPLLRAHDVRRLVIAGDLFEAGMRVGIARSLLAWLTAENVVLSVVPGNHDRGILDKPDLQWDIQPRGIRLGRWLVLHGEEGKPRGRVVQGHVHPWFQWDSDVGAPCYLVRDNHLVLPAYSADARGGNVVGKACWAGYRCAVVAGEAVLDFGLLGDLQRRYAKLSGGRLLTFR